MPSFDQKAFVDFLIAEDVVGFFEAPVTLKSGRTSHWYVNWRKVSNDVFALDQLASFLINFVHDVRLNPDCFFGVPEGATKLGILATYKWATVSPLFSQGSHPFPMGRAAPKTHGDSRDRFFVGSPRGNVVVVEDVTTTGGSLLATVETLSQIDCNIIAAIGCTNRMERRDDGKSVAEALQDRRVPYYALSEATDFLPQAFRKLNPGKKIGRAVEEECARHGLNPVVLVL